MSVPLCSSGAEGTTTDDSQSAVWTPKELTFVYAGFTTKYSCDGLRDKVTRALLQLGARKQDLKVQETACVRGFGKPDVFPTVRIKMSVLAPATGSSPDNTDVVTAHWRPVDLKLRGSDFPTDSTECELVEQIKSKIVPLFTTRNVNLRDDCVPHQASPSSPTLKLEVLALDTSASAVAATK